MRPIAPTIASRKRRVTLSIDFRIRLEKIILIFALPSCRGGEARERDRNGIQVQVQFCIFDFFRTLPLAVS